MLPPSINGFLIKSVKAVNGFRRRLNDPLTNLVKSLKIAVYVLINPSANPAASPASAAPVNPSAANRNPKNPPSGSTLVSLSTCPPAAAASLRILSSRSSFVSTLLARILKLSTISVFIT